MGVENIDSAAMRSGAGERSNGSPETLRRVRGNALPAAVAAALLLYFGYGRLSEPSGTDLFHQAGWVFYHTLRLGGLAMAAIAVWSWIGQRHALIVDAVASTVIGLLLIVTGAAMIIDGGDALQTLINVVCGGMFVSSGIRNGRDYFALVPATAAEVVDARIRTDKPPSREAPPASHSKPQAAPPAESTMTPPADGYLAALARKSPHHQNPDKVPTEE